MQDQEKDISPAEAMKKADDGALFVDVREEYELEQVAYDVPKVINIPLGEFAKRFTDLPKDRELVVVCLSGNRSSMATDFLLDNGYEKTFNLEGGISDWMMRGLPTKR